MTQKERLIQRRDEIKESLKYIPNNFETVIRSLKDDIRALEDQIKNLPDLIESKIKFDMTFKFKVSAKIMAEQSFKREDFDLFSNEYIEDYLADRISDVLAEGLEDYDLNQDESEINIEVIK